MAKKEGRGLYKRGGVWWLSYQKQHQRHWISLETEDYATAVEKADEVREAPQLNTGRRLVAEIDRYCKWKVQAGEFTRETDRSTRGFLTRLVRHFGDVTPVRITTPGGQAYYNDLIKSGMTAESARTYINRAASFLSWCVEVAGTVRGNPLTHIKRGKVVSRLNMVKSAPAARKEFCEPELRDSLIESCVRDDLRFALYCGFHAGLRRKEISEARPQWFDTKRGIIHITKISTATAKRTGLDPFDLKDMEERSIPLSKAFQEFLAGWLKPEDDYCLDPGGRRGLSRYRYDFSRPFDLHMEAQGCSWVTIHTMRRTFASLQVSGGTDLYKVAKWLGDDIRTTMKHYGHLMPDHASLEQGLLAVPRRDTAERPSQPL